MGTAANVRVGTSGTCEMAPEGTTLPGDADDALDPLFVDLGEISVDGLESAFEVSTEDIKNWAGETVRSLVTETMATFKITFLEERNQKVLELFYGQSVESQLGDLSRIKLAAPDNTPNAFVLTVNDSSDDSLKRYVIPRGVVTERETVNDKNSEASAYTCTITALRDDTVGGYGYVQFDNDLTS